MFHAPGMIPFYINLYRTQPELAFWTLVTGYPSFPACFFKDLLTGRIPYVIEGDTVVCKDWVQGPLSNYYTAPPLSDDDDLH